MHTKRLALLYHHLDALLTQGYLAMEVLSHSEKRRQFDSVDPYYLDLEESVPIPTKDWESNVFFSDMAPIFEREARFSRVQPVPMLGGVDDPKAAVEGFYDFWYNFDSWRSFEYLDKEVNEGSDRYVMCLCILCVC
jgi:DnaJ homolog subfamily C member 2